jgi:hypothetical protein
MKISISKKIISAYINSLIPTCHMSNKKLTKWSNIISMIELKTICVLYIVHSSHYKIIVLYFVIHMLSELR